MNDEHDPTGYYARKERRNADDIDGCLPVVGWICAALFLGFLGYGLLIAFGPRM